MQRRTLLKTASAFTILPSGFLRGQNTPSKKLNVALIGVWGRGTAHYASLRNENVVALCDVFEPRARQALAMFPGAKVYQDWRRVLDQKDVEAVVICTADHHHAFIANWAINRGMHVFCEKPLGITVHEARTVRENYLKNKAKVATQHGTQRHAYPNFERLRELILDGAIGKLERIHSWDARQLPRPGYPHGDGSPPAGLDFEQWIGPSPFHPYTPQYFGGSSGMNCLFWNMYRDFGVGQMGDMGAHTMDLVWNVVDAGAPATIEVDQEASDPFHPDICPVKLKVTFTHPANSWRGPVELVWYQGGLKPEPPRRYIDLTHVGNGAILEGDRGTIFADFTSRVILPFNDEGDLTYYRRRSKEDLLPLVAGTGSPTVTPRPSRRPPGPSPAPAPRPLPAGLKAFPNAQPGPSGFPEVLLMANGLPPGLGMENDDVNAYVAAKKAGRTPPGRPDPFQVEWLNACKGMNDGATFGTSSKTHCDFDYSGTMIEQMMLGLVAHRVGKTLEYDGSAGRVTNSTEANRYLSREYRKGWTLNG